VISMTLDELGRDEMETKNVNIMVWNASGEGKEDLIGSLQLLPCTALFLRTITLLLFSVFSPPLH
jgi:hypothetical protein